VECGSEAPAQQRRIGGAIAIVTAVLLLAAAGAAAGYTMVNRDARNAAAALAAAKAPRGRAATIAQANRILSETKLPASQRVIPAIAAPGRVIAVPAPVAAVPFKPTVPQTSASVPVLPKPNPGPKTPTGPAAPSLIDIALGANAGTYDPYPKPPYSGSNAGAVTDGDTSTSWTTSPDYPSPLFRPAIGVYVDVARPEAVKTLELDTPTPGMTVKVYAAASLPAKLSGWTQLATLVDVARTTTVQVQSSHKYRYWLVWVSVLPKDQLNAAVSEIRLLSLQQG
jgi:hypothetical protein